MELVEKPKVGIFLFSPKNASDNRRPPSVGPEIDLAPKFNGGGRVTQHRLASHDQLLLLFGVEIEDESLATAIQWGISVSW